MNNSRLVYSTQMGRVCPNCGKALKKCQCKKNKITPATDSPGDGILRIRREVKGRKGKGVTTISGFELGGSELKEMAARLKRRCGTGGSVKNGIIIIQGDHRNTLLDELSRQGYKAKLAGG
ncbi:MAG: translation initiation factor Sui1 [Desulfobacteraceae bacterium]|jgi:translation initiation factor 1